MDLSTPSPEEAQETWKALEALPEKLDFWNIVYILCLIAGCVLVYKLVMLALNRLLKRSRLDKSLHTFLRSVVRVALIFLAALVVADALGIPVTSLVALFSVVGLAVSLAVQGALSNLAGGLMVLSAKPFQVGDFVTIDNVSGTVVDVTLTHTKLSTTDNRLVYLTNKTVSETTVINFSAQDTRRVELTIDASYDAPSETVKSAILAVIGQHPKTLPTPEPIVRVAQFGASSISYHVRAWCAQEDYWAVYYDLLEGIRTAFDEQGVEMTYDHLNVHILDTPAPGAGQNQE